MDEMRKAIERRHKEGASTAPTTPVENIDEHAKLMQRLLHTPAGTDKKSVAQTS